MSPARRAVLIIVTVVVAVAAAIFGWRYYQFASTHESTDDAFIAADVAPISPRIAGHVIAIHVRDNQIVQAGQLLVELDPADLQAAVDAAQAALQTAQATLAAKQINVDLVTKTTAADIQQAQAGIRSAQAAIDATAAHLEQSKAQAHRDELTYERLKELVNKQATSQQSVDDAEADMNTSKANVIQSIKLQATMKARLGQAAAQLSTALTADQQVAVAKAQAQVAAEQVAQAKANLQSAQLQLSYTKIAAPVAGRITRKNLQPGQFISPGQPMMAIVQDDAWVVANFKETQLTRMKPGQPVEVEVDAYPGTTFRGHIDSMQAGSGAAFSLLPPENATGNYVKVVQRMPVKIVFDEKPDASKYLLGPGMSVVPTVDITAAGKAMNTQPVSVQAK